jgi:hypothetical protein
MRAVLPGLLPIRYTWGEATRRTLKMRVIVLSLLALTRPSIFQTQPRCSRPAAPGFLRDIAGVGFGRRSLCDPTQLRRLDTHTQKEARLWGPFGGEQDAPPCDRKEP